jgi:hypothetical protein
MFSCTGTDVYVYGTTDNARFSGQSKIGFELDGSPSGQDYSNPADWGSTLHNLFYSAKNLENKNHVVKITSLNDTPWYLDYVVYSTNSAQTDPSQTNSSQTNSSQTNSSQTNSSQTNSSQTNPSQTNLPQANSSQINSPHANSSQTDSSQIAGTSPDVSAKKTDTGVIVGGAIGGVALVGVLLLLAFLLLRRRRNTKENRIKDAPGNTSGDNVGVGTGNGNGSGHNWEPSGVGMTEKGSQRGLLVHQHS